MSVRTMLTTATAIPAGGLTDGRALMVTSWRRTSWSGARRIVSVPTAFNYNLSHDDEEQFPASNDLCYQNNAIPRVVAYPAQGILAPKTKIVVPDPEDEDDRRSDGEVRAICFSRRRFSAFNCVLQSDKSFVVHSIYTYRRQEGDTVGIRGTGSY